MQKLTQEPFISNEQVEQVVFDATRKPVGLIKKPENFQPINPVAVPEVQNAMKQDVIRTLGQRVVELEGDQLIDKKTGAGSEIAYKKDLQELLDTRPEDVRIILLDLNGFKKVNDTLGHEVGDEALRQFVGGIEEVALRTGERIYRIGGDEFVILSDLKVRRDRRQKQIEVVEERRTGEDRRENILPSEPARRTKDLHTLGRDDTIEGLAKRFKNGFLGADYIFHGYLERLNLINEAKPGDINYIEPESWNIQASWGVADYEDGDTAESMKERADKNMYLMKKTPEDIKDTTILRYAVDEYDALYESLEGDVASENLLDKRPKVTIEGREFQAYFTDNLNMRFNAWARKQDQFASLFNGRLKEVYGVDEVNNSYSEIHDPELDSMFTRFSELYPNVAEVLASTNPDNKFAPDTSSDLKAVFMRALFDFVAPRVWNTATTTVRKPLDLIS